MTQPGRGRRAPGMDAAPAGGSVRRDEYLDAVESVSQGIQDPVAKLRYLRGTMAKQEKTARAVSKIPISPLRRVMFRWLSLEALAPVLTSRWGAALPVDAETQQAYKRRRLVAVTAGIAICFTIAA